MINVIPGCAGLVGEDNVIDNGHGEICIKVFNDSS